MWGIIMFKIFSCPQPSKKKLRYYIPFIAFWVVLMLSISYPLKAFLFLIPGILWTIYNSRKFSTHWVYYAKGKVKITDEYIELLEYDCPVLKFKNKELHIGHYVSMGEYIWVFSNMPIEELGKKELKKKIKAKEAFCFPYDYGMQKAFPEWFGSDTYMLYM